jgi:hypothetical protein
VIGLLSDSQGDVDAFDAAYELLRGKGAKRFIFAGGLYVDLDVWLELRRRRKGSDAGGYTDADFLTDVTNFLSDKEQLERPPAFPDEWEPTGAAGAREAFNPDKVRERFVRVPDKESAEYAEGGAPRKAMDMIGDALCCVVHDKNDLDRDDMQNATVFVHGREPEPRVVQIGPRFFVTPGRLTGGTERTCALIEVVDRNLRFSAFRLDGQIVVDGQMLLLERRTKLSVK